MKEVSLKRKIHIVSFVLGIIFMGLGNLSLYAANGNAISLTGGNWAIGTVGPSNTTNTTGSTWTVTGSDDGSVDVSIQITPDAGCSWSAWETDDNNNTAEKFVLRETNSAGVLIKQTTAVTLKSALPPTVLSTGTYSFDLWFKAPPTGSTEESCTFTVTLTASNWNGNYCAGTVRDTTRCLYLATASATCAAFCAVHGGDAVVDATAYDTTWGDADPADLCADMEAIDSQTGWPCVNYTTNNYAPGTIDSQHYYRSSGAYSTSGSLASWSRLCDCNF